MLFIINYVVTIVARRYVAQPVCVNMLIPAVVSTEVEHTVRVEDWHLIADHLRSATPLPQVFNEVMLTLLAIFNYGFRIPKRCFGLIILLNNRPMTLLGIARINETLDIMQSLHQLSIVSIRLTQF